MKSSTYNKKQLFQIEYDNTMNLKVILLQIISIGLVSVLLLQTVKILISTGNFADIRAYFYSSDYADQHMFNLLCRQLPLAIMESLIVYYTYSAFIHHKLKYLLFAVFNVLFIILVSGGRYEVIFFMLVVLMTFMTNGRQISIKTKRWMKKYRWYVLFFIVLLIIPAIMITMQARSGLIFKEIITYSVGSLSFLDYIYTYSDLFGIYERLYGYMTFSFITEPIVLILKYFGITTIKTPSWYFNIHCQPFYNVGINGSSIYMNNNTSILYFLYYDFGLLGTLIGACFMGGFVSYVYNKTDNSMFFNIIYIYLSVALLLTVMYYRLFGIKPLFVILSLLIFSIRFKIGNKIL